MKFNPYQWYWYHKKRGMHEEAIQEVLGIIEKVNPKNPWAYGVKVMSIINGNYYERDNVSKHESVKEGREDFKVWLESNADFKALLKGVG